MLRAPPFNPADDLRELRPLFEKMGTAAPVPADVVTAPGRLAPTPATLRRARSTAAWPACRRC
jgi:hypothetical protein